MFFNILRMSIMTEAERARSPIPKVEVCSIASWNSCIMMDHDSTALCRCHELRPGDRL